MRVLITRPQSDAERTAAALRACGHTAILAPLLYVQPIAEAEIGAGPWSAILVTSANAAQAITLHAMRDKLLRVPVFAVGERSVHTMRAAGFSSFASANGGVGELAHLVTARVPPPGRLLYLAGEDRAGDLAAALRANGLEVETVVVYRAIAVEHFPQAAAAALTSGLDCVLHYSRRSAEVYIKAARRSGMLAKALTPTHCCLSAQVAEPLAAAGAAKINVAPVPNETALLALIGSNAT